MSWILFILYATLLCWLLTKLGFFRQSGIKQNWLIFIFLLHVTVGCVGGYWASFSPGADTWRYHHDALVEYQLLQTNPKAYFSNLFATGYAHRYDGFLQTQNSFWNDLKTNLMVKGVSILDILSGGNYYTNVLLFNFLLFFGWVALFKLFFIYYPQQKNACIFGVFLLPSVLYFGSVLHKEGLMLAGLGGIWYGWHTWLQKPIKHWWRLVLVLLLLLLVLLLRNYMLLAIVPALVSYAMVVRFKWRAWPVVGISFFVLIFVFWGARVWIPSLDLPKLVQQKQSDFLQLDGANTAIQLTALQPTGTSFIKVFPEAIQHALFRPFFNDLSLSWQLAPFIFEMLFYWVLFFYTILKKSDQKFYPLGPVFLLMSVIVLLLIGYTVPILGAIVRYRSFLLPFIITPLLVRFKS